jgi:glutathione peroxidase
MTTAQTLFDLTYTGISGKEVALSQYAGHPLLIVNTASKCGLTPQYEGLQQLHQEYGERGLVVLGFPCDQFAHQEPGAEAEIEEFCTVNYGVTFPLSSKIDVNGRQTDPVFAFVKKRAGGLLGTTIKWNFTKFLVAPDGLTVTRFSPQTKPEALRQAIEPLLSTTVV